MAQYLSLHQDSLTNTPNDLMSLAAGIAGVTVTLTDGDGDQVLDGDDVGTQISFLDDGPTAPTVTASAATVGVDETPGCRTRPRLSGRHRCGGDRYWARARSRSTVPRPRLQELFTGVLNKGTDPDVPAASLDNGALSFASSAGDVLNLPPLATLIASGAFGADGPAAVNPATYALTVSNAASGLTLTDGTAITLSLVGGRSSARLGHG